MRVLDRAAVERLLDGVELIDRLADGFVALSRGEVVAPARVELGLERGFSLAMPAYRPGGDLIVKIVNVFADNPRLGLPSHQAVICAFDAETGSCIALLDATAITSARTAAAAALSTRILARPDARVLTIVGAGVQGRAHLELLPLVRELDEIRIASRRIEDAVHLARLDERAVAVEALAAAVGSSDIVALCTHSGTPVIDAAWVRPGTHLTSVGYRAPDGELPRELLARASLVVETRIAFAPPPAGCFELRGLDPNGAAELGEVIAGTKNGRTGAEQVTVYKAMGHALEDHVATKLVLERASRFRSGIELEL